MSKANKVKAMPTNAIRLNRVISPSVDSDISSPQSMLVLYLETILMTLHQAPSLSSRHIALRQESSPFVPSGSGSVDRSPVR